MGRGPKPTKGKAKPAVSRKSPKNEDSKVRDLEQRLAEALRREAEALRQLQAQRLKETDALGRLDRRRGNSAFLGRIQHLITRRTGENALLGQEECRLARQNAEDGGRGRAIGLDQAQPVIVVLRGGGR